MTLGNELLTANVTLIVPLAFMTLKVHIEVSLLSKETATHIALEGFNTKVFAHVNFQP